MILVDKTADTPLYRQLFDSCRNEITSGRIEAGSKLPALRTLANDLGISRNTVESAYRQLVIEGYISSRPGGGYIVEKLDLDDMSLAESCDIAMATHFPTIECLDSSSTGSETTRYDFTYGNLQDDAFPADIWRKLTAEALFGEEAACANRYGNPFGDPLLRREIAAQLASKRGVRCSPEQVVILPGTQAALMRLLTLFDSRRDVVAMENPGFDGARIVFERQGFSTVPLSVDDQSGWNLDSLARSKARLVFVTPSSQFPTGKIMTLPVRQKLLNWAIEHDAFIIEDDYCREFRYGAQPLPALQSLDRHGRVIYMGTVSKALTPALRINYFVLPPLLLAAWRDTFEGFRCEVSWLSQIVLRLFMQQGYWNRMLKRVQTKYKRKHAALTAAVKKHLGDNVSVVESNAGLHILIETNDGRSAAELVETARDAGVSVYSTSRYWADDCDAAQRFVLVGFSSIEKEDIEPGIKALAHAWFPDQHDRHRPSIKKNVE